MALGVVGPLVIAVTDGPEAFQLRDTTEGVRLVEELRATTHADLLVYCYVATERSAILPAEQRHLGVRLANACDLVVGVHEGSGFRASVIRGVITGITLTSRSRPRPHVVGTTGEAAVFLAGRMPGTDVSELRGALEEVRLAATG